MPVPIESRISAVLRGSSHSDGRLLTPWLSGGW